MANQPKSILIIGSGGREHAFAQSMPKDAKIVVSPGNAGTASMPNVKNVALADDERLSYAKENRFDLTIIGPEAPLVDGLADDLRNAGLAVVGPDKAAAELESSKSFATDFMTRHDIPHPKSWFIKSYEEFQALDKPAETIVIKADGLAGGKGVVLPATEDEAKSAIESMFAGGYGGGALQKGIQIQERHSGPEVSAFVFTDGTTFTSPLFAQDHKRLLDGNKGPNTGGMGAYSPVPDSILSTNQADKIRIIAEKTIDGMRDEGKSYRGILYIGTMLSEQKGGDPIVIEYNVRFGDPESQGILTLMQRAGTDVYGLLASTDDVLNLELFNKDEIISRSAVTICLAAQGYPEAPIKGAVISGLDRKTGSEVQIQHGGTKLDGDKIIVDGGRVLYVTGVGNNIDAAVGAAYAEAEFIQFDGRQMRKDIAYQARKAA